MNVATILSSGAQAISLLALAGVPVPTSLLNVINKAAPIATAVQTIASNPPTNITSAVSDLATVAGAVEVTGLASADTEIATILAEVKKYTSSIANFESGQLVILLTYPVTVNGKAETADLVTYLQGGPAAQALGG